ncbi:MAG: amino acid ABC transporter permease [Ktedonobacteraceae bacterium]
MFRWDLFAHYLYGDPDLIFLRAAWTTLWISVVAQIIGVVLGLFLALMRTSHFKWLSWPAGAYIWFFRGSPLLVQVLLLWDGLPKLAANNPYLLLPDFACVLVAFSLNEGAYMAEIVRAGIGSVDAGQMEAGKALGMRFSLAMRRIVLPQAARVILPPLGNEFNNMLKTTSIASVIGVFELTNVATVYGSPTFSTFELLIVVTFYYLLLTTLWGYVQGLIEKRLDPNRNQKIELVDKKSLAERTLGLSMPRSGAR